MAMRDGLSTSEDGVSPVVGMILVLAISIVGIATILYWGLPAIDEMKANVEHRSVESQFHELDASIKELVAGTTEKTAKRWHPSLNRGQVQIANQTEAFVYAVEPYNSTGAHDFVYWGLTDADQKFTIRNNALTAVPHAVVQAYMVNSTTSGWELRVSTSAAINTQMGETNWAGSTDQDFYLWDHNGVSIPITNATIRFRIYDGVSKVAEAWYIPTGRIDYRLDAGLGTRTVVENNGALFSGSGDSVAMVNAPPIPPATSTNGVPRHFARSVLINGTGSFAGDDRFDVLVTLYSTITLGSYDCATVGHTDCVERVKIFPYGKYAAAWTPYLSNTGRGYTFTEMAYPGTPPSELPPAYLEDTDPWMGYTLLQSIVQLKGQT